MLACLLSYSSTNGGAFASVLRNLPTSRPLTIPSNGPTLLHLAAILDHCDTASQLLCAELVDISDRDHEGNMVLDKA